jgi:hypothetical protein
MLQLLRWAAALEQDQRFVATLEAVPAGAADFEEGQDARVLSVFSEPVNAQAQGRRGDAFIDKGGGNRRGGHIVFRGGWGT